MTLTATGDTSAASYIALTCFIMLTSGMFVGLYKMMKHWEDEAV